VTAQPSERAPNDMRPRTDVEASHGRVDPTVTFERCLGAGSRGHSAAYTQWLTILPSFTSSTPIPGLMPPELVPKLTKLTM
jgi:hypothetical protein